ncbi:conserved Plasmodium protein, unknown function [Plasmodium malariae]|uniref:Uncharacterized protein n=1 Tax=Plasmodium malariae TaxID=5858 RepID=A0A1C3L024_PLAMA|nr:conserved Plasmodium protein, unknown function [Plasmodium malariae]
MNVNSSGNNDNNNEQNNDVLWESLYNDFNEITNTNKKHFNYIENSLYNFCKGVSSSENLSYDVKSRSKSVFLSDKKEGYYYNMNSTGDNDTGSSSNNIRNIKNNNSDVMDGWNHSNGELLLNRNQHKEGDYIFSRNDSNYSKAEDVEDVENVERARVASEENYKRVSKLFDAYDKEKILEGASSMNKGCLANGGIGSVCIDNEDIREKKKINNNNNNNNNNNQKDYNTERNSGLTKVKRNATFQNDINDEKGQEQKQQKAEHDEGNCSGEDSDCGSDFNLNILFGYCDTPKNEGGSSCNISSRHGSVNEGGHSSLTHIYKSTGCARRSTYSYEMNKEDEEGLNNIIDYNLDDVEMEKGKNGRERGKNKSSNDNSNSGNNTRRNYNSIGNNCDKSKTNSVLRKIIMHPHYSEKYCSEKKEKLQALEQCYDTISHAHDVKRLYREKYFLQDLCEKRKVMIQKSKIENTKLNVEIKSLLSFNNNLSYALKEKEAEIKILKKQKEELELNLMNRLKKNSSNNNQYSFLTNFTTHQQEQKKDQKQLQKKQYNYSKDGKFCSNVDEDDDSLISNRMMICNKNCTILSNVSDDSNNNTSIIQSYEEKIQSRTRSSSSSNSICILFIFIMNFSISDFFM